MSEGYLPMMEFDPKHFLSSLQEAVHTSQSGFLCLGEFVDQGPPLITTRRVDERGWFPIYYEHHQGTSRRTVGTIAVERGERSTFISPTPYERLLVRMNRSLLLADEGRLPTGTIELECNTGIEGVERRDHRFVVPLLGTRVWQTDLSDAYPSDWFVMGDKPVVHASPSHQRIAERAAEMRDY